MAQDRVTILYIKEPKFPLGRIVATPGALAALEERGLNGAEFIRRHASGDWGDVCEEDHAENDYSLVRHLRLFSVYKLDEDHKLWVITEADRSATTLLLPSEY